MKFEGDFIVDFVHETHHVVQFFYPFVFFNVNCLPLIESNRETIKARKLSQTLLNPNHS